MARTRWGRIAAAVVQDDVHRHDVEGLDVTELFDAHVAESDSVAQAAGGRELPVDLHRRGAYVDAHERRARERLRERLDLTADGAADVQDSTTALEPIGHRRDLAVHAPGADLGRHAARPDHDARSSAYPTEDQAGYPIRSRDGGQPHARAAQPQRTMLAFIDLEERVPSDHPLRTIERLGDEPSQEGEHRYNHWRGLSGAGRRIARHAPGRGASGRHRRMVLRNPHRTYERAI